MTWLVACKEYHWKRKSSSLRKKSVRVRLDNSVNGMDDTVGGHNVGLDDNAGGGRGLDLGSLADGPAVGGQLVQLGAQLLAGVQGFEGLPAETLGVDDLRDHMSGQDRGQERLVGQDGVKGVCRNLGEGVVGRGKHGDAICK